MNIKNRSLNRRKDIRTTEQFKEDIKSASKRERMLIELWQREMEHRGHKIEVFDHGVDNSGEFVEHSNSNPDYRVVIDGKEELYEVKCNKWSHKLTFKVFDLKEYIRFGASILLFFGIGHQEDVVDYETTRWGIIEPKAMEWMLAGKTENRGDPKWGNKPTVIIYPAEYEGYFTEERLTFNDIKNIPNENEEECPF